MVTTTAINSATTTESQIPSIFHIKGIINTAAVWNKSVLKKDISAEVRPSLSAVKKEEPKIAIPEKIKEKA